MFNFKSLYEQYSNDVYRFALWLSGDKDDAEDITSETFIRAWVHHKKIRAHTLKAYLFSIARNIYLMQQRKEKHMVYLDDNYPDPSPTPHEQTDTTIELNNIDQFLLSLPATDRAVFILRIQDQIPYSEIAGIMGISTSCAKVKMHRIRKKLLAARTAKEN